MTKLLSRILGTIIIACLIATVAVAQNRAIDQTRTNRCSVATIAGTWAFATDIGEFQGGIRATALGTYNVGKDGSLNGTFDYNGTDGFYAGITYTGTTTVNPDCTGTANFTSAAGAVVSQTIVIVGDGQEIWGAFQDPNTIWTYQAKRISARK